MSNPLIIYIGCDGKYFNLYAEALIASIEFNSPNQHVFFNICNPLEDFEERFAKIKALALSTNINYETYIEDLSAQDFGKKKAFYANYRFVKLNEFFKKAQSNVLFLDIDTIIRNDLSCCDALFANSDIALSLRLTERRKRIRVLAACIFIRYNERTLHFLEQLSQKLVGQYTWFADQIQIYTLLTKHKEIRLSHFSDQYLNWTFTPEALIWSGKGERKFYDDTYTGYTQKLLSHFTEQKPWVEEHHQPIIEAQPIVNIRRPHRLYKTFERIYNMLTGKSA